MPKNKRIIIASAIGLTLLAVCLTLWLSLRTTISPDGRAAAIAVREFSAKTSSYSIAGVRRELPNLAATVELYLSSSISKKEPYLSQWIEGAYQAWKDADDTEYYEELFQKYVFPKMLETINHDDYANDRNALWKKVNEIHAQNKAKRGISGEYKKLASDYAAGAFMIIDENRRDDETLQSLKERKANLDIKKADLRDSLKVIPGFTITENQ